MKADIVKAMQPTIAFFFLSITWQELRFITGQKRVESPNLLVFQILDGTHCFLLLVCRLPATAFRLRAHKRMPSPWPSLPVFHILNSTQSAWHDASLKHQNTPWSNKAALWVFYFRFSISNLYEVLSSQGQEEKCNFALLPLKYFWNPIQPGSGERIAFLPFCPSNISEILSSQSPFTLLIMFTVYLLIWINW